MRALLVILFVSLSFLGIAQRKLVYGIVQDQDTKEVVIGSHIRNLATGRATSSNHEGLFTISAKVGDTLLFSNIGYQRLGWVAEENWFDESRVEFFMSPDTIMLQEVVIGKLPEYDHFKQLIIETQPVDTDLEIFGLAAIPMDVPVATEADMQRTTGLSMGFTFDMDGLTKRGKEKRKLEKILERKGITQKAQSKFNRDWVAKETQLSGDKLTSFIAYCDFTPEYLTKTTLYAIHEKMMALLSDFMTGYSEG